MFHLTENIKIYHFSQIHVQNVQMHVQNDSIVKGGYRCAEKK